jgi:hypothetical protein
MKKFISAIFTSGLIIVLLLFGCSEKGTNPQKPNDDTSQNNPPEFFIDATEMTENYTANQDHIEDTLYATDSDNDNLVFAFIDSVQGMVLNGNIISWSPTIRDTGSHQISVQVSDGNGGIDTLGWTITIIVLIPPIPPSAITITILSSSDSTPVVNPNIMLYDAEKNEALTRIMSDTIYECVADADFFVKITAQGYNPLPPEYTVAVPFRAVAQETTAVTYYMTPLTQTLPGQLQGYVYLNAVDSSNTVEGVLVIAENSADHSKYTAVSGPHGYFVLFNLPYGTYTLVSYREGYTQLNSVSAVLSDTSVKSVNIIVNKVSGGTLTGSVQCVATSGPATVDVALLDSATFSTIPGLMVQTDASTNYTIANIPPGRYLAWVSFKNDGYVIDPDVIFKFGGPMVTFAGATTLTLNFTITGAIEIISPTNQPDQVYPVMADSIVPTFVWTRQSSIVSAKEYIIEVKDMNGNILWGGYDRATGAINHAQIAQVADTARVLYDFDGQGAPRLQPGVTYQWKLYADDNSAAGVQTLISSSEDLMGFFTVP